MNKLFLFTPRNKFAADIFFIGGSFKRLCLTFVVMSMVFAAHAQPAITSLSTYLASPGSALTISGTGFNSTTANNTVYFGATKANVSSASATSVVVTVPSGATVGPVSITNTATGLMGYASRFFLPTFNQSAYTPTLNFDNRSFLFLAGLPTTVTAGDIDGDGNSDLIVSYEGGGASAVTIYRNIGTAGTLSANSFASPVTLTGSQGTNLLIADLNGDGKPEIIVGGGEITIFKNNCTPGIITAGSFGAAVVLPVGVSVRGLKIADMDRDGKPDLVASGGAAFSIIKNNISGSTIATSSFTTVTFSIGDGAIALGDIDGDGKVDIAKTNFLGFAIFRNVSSTGVINSGSLEGEVDFSTPHTGGGPTDIIICDIDGNGKPEVITANYSGNSISVLKNTATSGSITSSSLATHVDFVTGEHPMGLGIGDMDGDGKPDVVVANHGDFFTNTSASMSVFRNTSVSGTISTGSLAPKSDHNIYLVHDNVAVADLDGDGRPDVITTGYTDLHPHEHYIGMMQNFSPSPVVSSVSPVAASPGTTVTVSGTNFNTTPDSNIVYFGATKATVSVASHTSLTATVPVGASYGPITVNNKALQLTAYPQFDFLPTYDNSMYVPGHFNFDPKVDVTAGSSWGYTALGDLDGDGKADLVVSTTGSISVFRNVSTSGTINSASFSSPVTFSVTATYPPISNVFLKDIDGDGKLDIVAGITDYFCILRNQTVIPGIFNSGSLALPVTYYLGKLLDVNDVDGDGKPDMLTINASGHVAAHNLCVPGVINSNSFETSAYYSYAGSPETDNSVLKDINGDGKPDIFYRGYIGNGFVVEWNHSVEGYAFYPLDYGDYTSMPPFSFYDALYMTSSSTTVSANMAIGDIDGDGKPDVVAADTGGICMLRNLSTGGAGAFGPRVHIHLGFSPNNMKLNDIDGDGKPDLILINYTSNSVTVLRNSATSGTITASSFTPSGVNFATSAGPGALITGDIDGDGKPDLVVACESGVFSILRNNPVLIDSMAIAGPLSVCAGSSVTLSILTSGGTWSSSNTSVATIGTGTGVVTGIGAGTAIISYITSGGTATAIVTVNPLPNAGSITAVDIMCATGAVTCTSSGSTGGVWSSSNTAIGTINASTGNVSGISGGTMTISYTVTNGCGTSIATHVMTVLPLPIGGTISGTASVCAGSTTALSSSGTSGGTWSSSNAAVGTVSATGVVTGIASGTATISYNVTTSCGTATATRTATVNTVADAGTITGLSSVSTGATITLSDAVSGGSWSASNSHASVSSGGVVSGISVGTVTVSYSVINSCGTAVATKIITVGASLDPIGGTLAVCAVSTTALTGSPAGGTWASSNVGVVMINSAGIATGIAAGTATVVYTIGGSSMSAVVTVNPLPATISGAAGVCLNATTALSDATGGGLWSSSNTSIASVDAASGIVTGNSVASTTITYTLPTGCYRTLAMIVKPVPVAITGSASLCPGSSATYTDATTGGVSWSSSTLSVGTIGATSGVLTAISTGTTTVTYTVLSGCVATKTVSVNALPATISGTPTACAGSTAMLTDADAGGTWSSTVTGVATISSTGTLTAIGAGVTNIIYSTGAGCNRSMSFTVNPLPSVITGSTALCAGATSALGDVTTGGTWSSGSPSVATVGVTGLVTGVSTGTSVISYILSTGCARTTTVSVSGSISAITGSLSTCIGATTILADATSGGTWSSSNAAIASVSGAGLVTGASAGMANITYMVASCRAIATVTVSATIPAITGATASVCINASITLADAVAGGTWSSSNPSLGTVSTLGVVTGIAAGTTTISYIVSSGCFRTQNITVKALPGAISGNTGICTGATSTVTDGSGVSWSSSTPSVATIGAASGVITGISAGTSTITFNATSGCIATKVVTVDAAPSVTAITGPAGVAMGHTITLSDATPGGVWSSNNPANASVSAGGVVTGIAAPAATIIYAVTNGVCKVSMTKLVSVTTSRAAMQPGSDENANVRVYPNPSSGVFTVETSIPGVFVVYTLEGKEVQRNEVLAGANMLSLPKGLAAGIYMCRFNGEDNSTVMVKLVYEQ